MPNIENHAPGGFCWVELGTTDQAAAADFYRQIFGWSAKNMPIGPDEVYTMFQLEGRDAAAGYKLRADQLSRGVPRNWNHRLARDALLGRLEHSGSSARWSILFQPLWLADHEGRRRPRSQLLAHQERRGIHRRNPARVSPAARRARSLAGVLYRFRLRRHCHSRKKSRCQALYAPHGF